MDNKYLNTKEAAKILKRNKNTLEIWRSNDKGPKYFKDGGGKVWYTEQALVDFIEGRDA